MLLDSQHRSRVVGLPKCPTRVSHSRSAWVPFVVQYRCSAARMPVGGGVPPPPSAPTNARVPPAAQHALLEDIQPLRPAGATPSTGVRVPVTDSNMDLNSQPWTWSTGQPSYLIHCKFGIWVGFFWECLIYKLNGLKRGERQETQQGFRSLLQSGPGGDWKLGLGCWEPPGPCSWSRLVGLEELHPNHRFYCALG